MYNSNQGYGISGAKNIYSSDVKIHNWVEDDIGKRLVEKPRKSTNDFQTTQSISYVDPAKRPPPPKISINIPSTQELKIKNKDGMPYSMLFDHGLTEIPSEVFCQLFMKLINLY
jgi:hypothetical protein